MMIDTEIVDPGGIFRIRHDTPVDRLLQSNFFLGHSIGHKFIPNILIIKLITESHQ